VGDVFRGLHGDLSWVRRGGFGGSLCDLRGGDDIERENEMAWRNEGLFEGKAMDRGRS